jgi:hypothetical protein
MLVYASNKDLYMRPIFYTCTIYLKIIATQLQKYLMDQQINELVKFILK